MKIRELLNEDTVDNMRVLRDCTELVIKNMPYTFPIEMDDIYWVSNFDGRGNLLKKYENTKYQAVVNRFVNSYNIRYINPSEIYSTAGAHAIGMGNCRILFNISAFMGQSGDFTRHQILEKVNEKTKAFKTFKAIVLHELRHLMQHVEYPNYSSNNKDTEYAKDPIEIDAAWHHHLEDYSPQNYSTAASYTKDVMLSFVKYKKLSDKQLRHYTGKTASYWLKHARKDNIVSSSTTLVDKVKARHAQIASVISTHIQSSNRPTDLRSVIPNYDIDSRMFSVPLKWYSAVSAMINKRTEISKANAVIAYLLVALTVPKNEISIVQSYLTKVSKITLTDAFEGCSQMSKNGYDGEAIRSFMRSVYL